MSTAIQQDEETALMIPPDLHITRAPKEVLESAREAAAALKEVISHKLKKVVFNGEQYLQYEDWQTIGGFFGCSPATGDAELVQIDGVPGFKAKARVIDANGIEVSTAEAYCMKDEYNWKSKPFFQLASMAQTRAGAKALRNKFAWVAVLAGYSPTPAEEVVPDEEQEAVPVCPECKKTDAVIKGKAEYGGGYLCFKKKGGCGAKWATEKQTAGYGTDAALRDDLFNQAEKYMIGRNYPEDKRKDALGRLAAIEKTEDIAKAVDKLVTGGKPDATERERDKKLSDLINHKDVTAEMIDGYTKEYFNGTPPEKLSLDALNQMYDDLTNVEDDIPF